MALVLCTGADPALMKTRQLLLEGAGHRVVTAADQPALIAACQQHAFDVAVIGQTASSTVKRRVLLLIREHCPSTRILELYQFSIGRILEDADAWLEVPTHVPKELAQQVRALAQKVK